MLSARSASAPLPGLDFALREPLAPLSIRSLPNAHASRHRSTSRPSSEVYLTLDRTPT